MTKVIHIRKAPPGWRNDPKYVFIGRPGPWGNPFHIGKYSRAEAIRLYERHIRGHDVSELRGKILVCYCKPKACHGDVLVRMCDPPWEEEHADEIVDRIREERGLADNESYEE